MAQDTGQTVDVLVIGAGMAGLMAAAEALLAAGNIDARRSTGRSPSANIAD